MTPNPKAAFTHHVSQWREVCSNRACKSDWYPFLRGRAFSRFEGKRVCSSGCMERIIADTVRSQIESWELVGGERALRMPLGLILLSRGWICHRELQEALTAQRVAGTGRIGEWLCRLQGISEETIAKALGIQWNCAVLPRGIPNLEKVTSLIPAFLSKHYDLTLLRQGPDATLYLAGRYRAEHAAACAIEHMLREPVHVAFLEDSAWNSGDAGAHDASELCHPGSDGVVARIHECIERVRPCDVRLARVHDHLWLRMWQGMRGGKAEQARDLVFPLRARTDGGPWNELDYLEQPKNPLH